MQRMIALLLIFMLAFGAVACTGKQTVSITLNKELLEVTSISDFEKLKAEDGIKDVHENDDGSFTVTLTKAKQKEMLKEISDGTQELIDKLISGVQGISSFKSVEFNADHSKFTILADGEKYNQFENLTLLGFYLTGAVYQLISGVVPEQVHVDIEVLDSDTKALLFSSSSAETSEGK